MSEESKSVIKTLDKNLEILKDVNNLKDEDVIMLFLELFGALRDMWERFEYVFDKVKQIKEIDEATEKGENYEEKISVDAKRLYL